LLLAGVRLWQRGAKCILSQRDGPSLAGERSSVANKCNKISSRRRSSRSLTVAVLYWKSNRNISRHYARKLSLLLTPSGAPIFMSRTLLRLHNCAIPHFMQALACYECLAPNRHERSRKTNRDLSKQNEGLTKEQREKRLDALESIASSVRARRSKSPGLNPLRALATEYSQAGKKQVYCNTVVYTTYREFSNTAVCPASLCSGFNTM
jgi:hypothetical protein